MSRDGLVERYRLAEHHALLLRFIEPDRVGARARTVERRELVVGGGRAFLKLGDRLNPDVCGGQKSEYAGQRGLGARDGGNRLRGDCCRILLQVGGLGGEALEDNLQTRAAEALGRERGHFSLYPRELGEPECVDLLGLERLGRGHAQRGAITRSAVRISRDRGVLARARQVLRSEEVAVARERRYHLPFQQLSERLGECGVWIASRHREEGRLLSFALGEPIELLDHLLHVHVSLNVAEAQALA